MKLSKRAQVATIVSALAVVALTAPDASSRADTTPPVLKSPVKASFVVGGQLGIGYHPDCSSDPHEIWTTLPAKFAWTGSDNSGSVRYSLDQSTGYDGRTEIFTNSTRTSYRHASDNSSQACGGGNGTVYEWELTASDPAGNRTTNNVYGGQMRLTQDTGTADSDGYAPKAFIAYAGAWHQSLCACWSDGGTHRTAAAGASARITFEHKPDGLHVTYPMHVGLIMHTGPDRGEVKVYVGGVLKATVDTFAATSRPRVMVWQTSIAEAGTPVRIVNVATPGRARIDLDAVVTN
jgi:hypothetical protein